jgi:hypothetical protein
MAEHPRTTSARDHDDHEMIDAAAAEGASGTVGHAGGKLATDIGTQDDINQAVGAPGDTTRPEKQDAINNDTAYPADRRGA